MEKKVDYSKDIQVTNTETNETFPARLLVNDPEFGVIVGFTDNNGETWIHSESYSDYESIKKTMMEVSNVPELEVKVGDVIKNDTETFLIVSLNKSYIRGLNSKGRNRGLEIDDSFRLVTGDEAIKFRISIAVNSGYILFPNGKLYYIPTRKDFNKVVLDNNSTWIFQLAEIKENGDIMASYAVNMDTRIIIPTSTLQKVAFTNLNELTNAKSFKRLFTEKIALETILSI